MEVLFPDSNYFNLG